MTAELLVPMRAWSARQRRVVGVAAVVLGALLAVALVGRNYPAFHIPDSHHYLQIARGRTAITMHPFAERQLGPRVAAVLGHAAHGLRPHSDPVHLGFLLEAGASLLALLGVVVWLALRTTAPRFLLPAILLAPHWRVLAMTLIYPDLLYAALVALLLFLMEQELWLAAAAMMLPLMLARESTWLTLLCLLVAAWGVLRWRGRIGAALAALLGAGVVARLTAHSVGNPEHLPGAVYVLAKLPWNFLRNVLGIVPWSNVNTDMCRVPAWSMALHAGPVRAIGVCGISFEQPLVALQLLLANFGLLPLLAVYLWWRRRSFFRGSPVLRFCLLYGAAGVVLAPLLGAGFEHLIGYAWPLFWVAPVLLLDERQVRAASRRERAAAMAFFAVHLVLCLFGSWRSMEVSLGLKTALEALLWAAGFAALRTWLGQPRSGSAPIVENASIDA